MIEKMTKYAFILLNGEEKDFLARLQELGMLDITRSVKPVDNRSTELLSQAESLRSLISALKQVEIEEDIPAVPVEGDLRTAAEEGLRQLAALKTEKAAAEKALALAEGWGDYDAARFQALQEAGLKIRFHRVPTKSFNPEWAEEVPLAVIAEEKSQIRFVTVLPADETDPLPGETPAPAGAPADLRSRCIELDEAIRQVKGTLLTLRQHSGELDASYRNELSQLDLYLAGVAAVPAAEETVVTLVGYAPTEEEAAVSAALDETGVFYFKEAARAEEDPPIKLKNNKFTGMFKVLTDMYGRPGYDGFDPTPFLSVFFLLFFALCMGDAGYGLVLIILGLLMRKSEGFGKMSPLVITLGAGTVVVGFFLHTFFSMDISQWKIFEPIQGVFLPAEIAGFDGTMVLSLIVGVVHLSLAMIVKTVMATKNNGFLESLGTWGWTLLIVGGVIVGGIALTGVIDTAVAKWAIIVIGILSALGIFLFNNIHRNPLVNIGSGLWDTYNTATGLLGDILSYLRLYALGLAGAMLGYAFNDLGKMILGDGGIVGWIFCIIVVLIGHTLNIAMCALGAFVHPLRLNFLEFFKNSGYEGSGRNFKPLTK